MLQPFTAPIQITNERVIEPPEIIEVPRRIDRVKPPKTRRQLETRQTLPVKFPVKLERKYQRLLDKLFKELAEAAARRWKNQLLPLIQQGRQTGRFIGDSVLVQDALNDIEAAITELEQEFSTIITAERAQNTASGVIVETHTVAKLEAEAQVTHFGITILGGEAAMKEILAARIRENVSLIKSIPQQYHADVERTVLNGIINGTATKDIAKSLTDMGRKYRNRNKLIARDQIASALGQATRQTFLNAELELGQWIATIDERVRKSHLAAHMKIYPLKVGLEVDGVLTFPGLPINCRCRMVPVRQELLKRGRANFVKVGGTK